MGERSDPRLPSTEPPLDAAPDGLSTRVHDAEVTARLAAIVESSNDAIIGKTLDGVITSWNDAAARMYGYAAAEIIGHHVSVLIPPDRVGELAPLLERVRQGEPVESFETQRVSRDGRVLDVSVTISPIRDASGSPIGASTVARDLTNVRRAEADHRELEAQLHQAQRLESIGQLAGGIAHDFNNLLAGIMNYAALVSASLQEDADRRGVPDDDEFLTILEDVNEITTVAKRAATLTRQLLIFSRRKVVQPEVLDLNSVVRDMEGLLRRTIGENVDKLRTELSPDLPLVKADRGQIEQVVMNLVVNARHAMPGGGELTIETSTFDVDEDYARPRELSPGPHVRLTVSDTGTGMSGDVAARAFEPFFTTKPKGEGSGLGLATVYGIVAQAGGEVSISSELGLGTTIRVNLPVTTEQARSGVRDAGPDEPRAPRGETVLLVEDEAIVRDPVQRMLSRHGYTVLAAGAADEAMMIVREHPGTIHLLLTDVVMPGRSGKELSIDVVSHRPATKVLFMSGYSQDVIVHQGVLDEGARLIEKPFSADALLCKLREVLDS